MPRTVLLDASETLIRSRHSMADRVVTASGGELEPATATQALRLLGAEGLWPDDEPDPRRRHAGWARFVALAVRRAGGVPQDRLCEEAATDILDPAGYVAFPDAIPALRMLRADRHVRAIGLVSNFDPWLREVLDRLGLTSYFDHLSISGETGLVKPDARAVLHAVGALGAEPADTCLVGDSVLVDVAAAVNAGVRPVLIDRDATTERPIGVHVVADLRDLAGLVRSRW